MSRRPPPVVEKNRFLTGTFNNKSDLAHAEVEFAFLTDDGSPAGRGNATANGISAGKIWTFEDLFRGGSPLQGQEAALERW